MAQAYRDKRTASQEPQGERISTYFEPEKGQQYVRRFELQAILVHYDKARQQNTLWSKFVRWLRTPRGKPVYAVEPPPENKDQGIE